MLSAPMPLITLAQMRAMDAAAPALGAPVHTLMQRAGHAVAEAIQARFSPRPTAVLCGPGANGGDGWVCAHALRRAGWPVWVESLEDPAALHGEAAAVAAAYRAAGGEAVRLGEGGKEADLCVDALFGAGLSRPLTGPAAAAAQAWAARWQSVVAVDVPSGLHGDTAKPMGDLAFRAGLTVTFEAKKPAHLLQPGRSLCGDVIVAPIGMPAGAWAAAGPPEAMENTPALWLHRFPQPDALAHKHARGHAMVVSGGVTQTGAARLAASGALRAGAGLVTVLSPPEAVFVHAAHLTAAMLRKVATPEALAASAQGAHAIVIGPALGLDERARASLLAVLAAGASKVLDADVFSLFKADPQALFAALQPQDVLTPHVGEFERVFPWLLAASVNRIGAVKAAAKTAGAVTLLKGPDTVIAAPDGRCAVNAVGSPYLATAGSGDVLAGLIAGLLAQGMEAFDAACAGVYLHGACGESLGPGLIAEDLPGAVPGVLRALLAQRA